LLLDDLPDRTLDDDRTDLKGGSGVDLRGVLVKLRCGVHARYPCTAAAASLRELNGPSMAGERGMKPSDATHKMLEPGPFQRSRWPRSLLDPSHMTAPVAPRETMRGFA
jgi:hypothetical protein